MPRFVGFIGPSYTLSSVNADAQRCVNLFPELNELGTGKNREVAALKGRPGLLKLATMGSGPGRGIYRASNGVVFAVSGDTVYNVTTPAAPVSLGTISTSSGPVSMADNGVEMVLVDGTAGYHVNLSTLVLAQITDPDFPPGANVVQFFDNFLIVNEPGTQRFWWSTLGDGTEWDALDFASSEGNPDEVITFLVDHLELVILNRRTVELFFNASANDPDNPFQRKTGGMLEHGIQAAETARKMDNTVFWVGENENGAAVVWRGQNYEAQRVSTHAVEQALKGYGDIASASAFTYQLGGHSFYCLNCPNAKVTWCFDASTGLWHEATYTRPDGQGEERWRVEHHCFAGNRHLALDYENGNLYELRDDVYTDDGAPITWRRRAPHANEPHNEFQVQIEAGVGLATGNGSDPHMLMRFSGDGGHTWSQERRASMGKQGEYKRICTFRRVGAMSVREGAILGRVYDVYNTEPVKQAWISAFLN